MELLTANAGSYPRVGDTPELQILRRTTDLWEKKEKTDADLAGAQHEMTRRAIQEQEAANLDLVTDGMIRWYDPISHVAGQLSGVNINGLLRFFDTNFYFRQPVITGPVTWKSPILVEEYRFAAAAAKKPVKVVLTGPYTLAAFSIRQGNGHAQSLGDLTAQYAAALASEIEALAKAGAPVIQVDEPAILKHPGDIGLLRDAIGALAAKKGTAKLALHTYFGDAEPLYDTFQALPVDILGFDFTYSPRLVDVIAGSGSAKTLALGLVDGRNTRLDDPKAVLAALDRIAKTAAGPAYLVPTTGLEYLPRDRAAAKLGHLTSLKQSFLKGGR